MGFLSDFFSAPKPCALCRLGHGNWERNRTGMIDWQLRGNGLDVQFRICPACSEAITAAGLRQHLPMVAMVALVQQGRAARPQMHAYFQHPEWRKVWMHIFELVGVAPSDEFHAVIESKTIEQRLFDEGPSALASAKTSSAGAARRLGSVGKLLRQRMLVVMAQSPEVQFLKDVIASFRVEHECMLLLIGVIWVEAAGKYGDARADEIIDGVLSRVTIDAETRPSMARLAAAIDECRAAPTPASRFDVLTMNAMAAIGIGAEEHGSLEALTELVNRGSREFDSALDLCESAT